MGFNVFGGSKESLLAPVVTKEAMEAQSAQSLAQVAKKYSKILSDISQGEAKLIELGEQINQLKKDRKQEEKAFSEQLLNREQTISEREINCKSRESTLETKQNEFQAEKNAALQDIASKEDRLLLLKTDLGQLKTRLESREAAVNSREKAVILKEADIETFQKKAEARSTDIEKKIAASKSELEAIQQRSAALQEDRAKIDEYRAVSVKRANELNDFKARLDIFEGELKKKEAVLEQKTETAETLSRNALAASEAAAFMKKEAEGQAIENQTRQETLDEREAKLNTLRQQLMGEKSNG